VLNEPEDALQAPQFHTVISPFGHIDWVYAQVTWNYRELPEFEPGGLQVQAWAGEECSLQKNFGYQELSSTAETVKWTQALETDGAVLTFEIVNGESVTWGAFGGTSLRIQGTAPVPVLNAYDTNVSVKNSLVSFGANRVKELVITQVRYYGAEGLLGVDANPRVVYQGDQGGFDESDADGVAPGSQLADASD
jgi:hypothetical protein